MFRPGTKVGVNTAPAVKVEPISGFRSRLPPVRTDGLPKSFWLYVAGMPAARQLATRCGPPALMLVVEHGSANVRKLSPGGLNRSSMFGARTARATPPRIFTSSLIAQAMRAFQVLAEP